MFINKDADSTSVFGFLMHVKFYFLQQEQSLGYTDLRRSESCFNVEISHVEQPSSPFFSSSSMFILLIFPPLLLLHLLLLFYFSLSFSFATSSSSKSFPLHVLPFSSFSSSPRSTFLPLLHIFIQFLLPYFYSLHVGFPLFFLLFFSSLLSFFSLSFFFFSSSLFSFFSQFFCLPFVLLRGKETREQEKRDKRSKWRRKSTRHEEYKG